MNRAETENDRPPAPAVGLPLIWLASHAVRKSNFRAVVLQYIRPAPGQLATRSGAARYLVKNAEPGDNEGLCGARNRTLYVEPASPKAPETDEAPFQIQPGPDCRNL